MIVSIHQPNFMPWYPFFQKMKQCDIFVILKECQFEKNNFQNRFNIDNFWHTMSVNKGLQPIKDKRYVSYERDWSKIKKRLYMYDLSIFDDYISESLLDTNIEIIKEITKILNINCQIELDFASNLTSTERLVNICKHYGAKKYIAGSGGRNYMDTSKFLDCGIEVEFQNNNDMIKKPILEIINV